MYGGGKFADLLKLQAEVFSLRANADLLEHAALAAAFPAVRRAWSTYWQGECQTADDALKARVVLLEDQANKMGLPNPSAPRHSLVTLDPLRRTAENRKADTRLFAEQNPVETADEKRLAALKSELRRVFEI